MQLYQQMSGCYTSLVYGFMNINLKYILCIHIGWNEVAKKVLGEQILSIQLFLNQFFFLACTTLSAFTVNLGKLYSSGLEKLIFIF